MAGIECVSFAEGREVYIGFQAYLNVSGKNLHTSEPSKSEH
jgi:hypothetical protein